MASSSSPIIFKHNYSVSKVSPHSPKSGSSSPSYACKRSSSLGIHKAIKMSSASSSSSLSSAASSSSCSCGLTIRPNNSHGLGHHRRRSCFNSSNSPYARRKSFLSQSMLENDDFQSYEVASYEYYTTYGGSDSSSASSSFNGSRTVRLPSFSLNLTQSQGFIWNQDLFASHYQQHKAGLTTSDESIPSHPVEIVDVMLDDDNSSDQSQEDEDCGVFDHDL
ncbi:unnamed protein product [Ambrosiozyma monospora]|uniref:Unnamed protein product n=1 Tax=Ambrosiozyma monospora TaxID=43982 RepID=A0ACB5T7I2_AMBMO|nr:unnamed protein product [Ambrosiozyma monospora]